MHLHTPEELAAKVGADIGVSDWLRIDQDMINRFADLTEDHQFIHVDPVRAASTVFGGTIAHGFLVLSLLSRMGLAAQFAMKGAVMGVNYGFDKVRMIAPVRAGARVRGRFTLKDFRERAPGQWMATLGVTVDIEGGDKPAIIADWVCVQFVGLEGA